MWSDPDRSEPMRGSRLLPLLFMAALSACGRSGKHPEFYPEARFIIEPLGGQAGTTFQVEYIADGVSRHVFQDGRTFTATEPVSFFLDNAPPPHGARFTWLEGAEADVVLVVSGQTIQFSPVRLGPSNPTVELKSVDRDGGTLATETDRPEIRLEVSADPGTLFQATIGDFFLSYDTGFSIDDEELLQPRAPAIIFFENARETVSAVARNANELEITIDLYVDGILKDSDTARKDAIVKHDL
jgi:hypothetical protein